jgi:hypothetical protein
MEPWCEPEVRHGCNAFAVSIPRRRWRGGLWRRCRLRRWGQGRAAGATPAA